MAAIATSAAIALPLVVRAEEPSAEAAQDWRARPLVQPSDDGKAHTAPVEAARPSTGEDGIEPEDIGLAIPRFLLMPPRLALEAAFLPIKGALYLVGKYKIPDRVIDFLYNDERNAAIIPSISILGGQGISVGVTAFHGGWGHHDEKISFSAKFGGRYVQHYELELTAPHVAGSSFGIDVLTQFEVEPHLRFYGYGAGALQEGVPEQPVGPRVANVETLFMQQRAMVLARPYLWLDKNTNLGIVGTLNRRDPGQKEDNDAAEPSIDEVYDPKQLPGFEHGYTLSEALLDLKADARIPEGATADGVYFHAFGGGAPPQNGWAFVHYAAEIAGFFDLYHGDRVLVLHAAHEGVWAEDDAQIPFLDMPRLGGPNRLRGYDLDRFRDKTTALATIEYHWPIHEYVGGVAFFEVGSVGRDYEDLFTPDNFRFSGGGGFSIRSRDAKILSIQVAGGEGVQFFLTTDTLPAFAKRAEQL